MKSQFQLSQRFVTLVHVLLLEFAAHPEFMVPVFETTLFRNQRVTLF